MYASVTKIWRGRINWNNMRNKEEEVSIGIWGIDKRGKNSTLE